MNTQFKRLGIVALVLVSLAGCGSSSTDDATASPTPAASASGLSIVSVKKLVAGGLDYCSYSSQSYCTAQQGQIVTYSDGTVYVEANFSFLEIVGSSIDSDVNSVSFYVPAGSASMSSTALYIVSRGTSATSHAVFLVYQRSNNLVSVWWDTNGNEKWNESGDTLIEYLTQSDY